MSVRITALLLAATLSGLAATPAYAATEAAPPTTDQLRAVCRDIFQQHTDGEVVDVNVPGLEFRIGRLDPFVYISDKDHKLRRRIIDFSAFGLETCVHRIQSSLVPAFPSTTSGTPTPDEITALCRYVVETSQDDGFVDVDFHGLQLFDNGGNPFVGLTDESGDRGGITDYSNAGIAICADNIATVFKAGVKPISLSK